MQLRQYQQEAIRAIYEYFAHASGNPLIVLPTGSGKSPTIGQFIKEVVSNYENQKIIMVTHVSEIVAQNADKLKQLWPEAPVGVYASKLKRKETIFPITMASIQSIYKNAGAFGYVQLIIIDEAHMLSNEESSMYRIFIRALQEVNPRLKVIGFTATPYRMKGGLLTNGNERIFTDIIYDAEISALMNQGYLCPLVTRSSKVQADLSAVPIRGGEYVGQKLEEAMLDLDLTSRALSVVFDETKDRRAGIVFCAGIKHAETVLAYIREKGYVGEIITGKTPIGEREEIIERFKKNKIKFLVNVDVLTTGFDAPNTDFLVLLRATMSAGLYYQMLGRGFRPLGNGMEESIRNGKSNCLVLDFAGNLLTHGPVNMLEPLAPKKQKPKACPACEAINTGLALKCRECGFLWRDLPSKRCPVCASAIHASSRFCKSELSDGRICNYEFPVPPSHGVEASEGEIVAQLPSSEGEEFAVSGITFSYHMNQSKRIPILKAIYFCGMNRFTQWICFEHHGFARQEAMKWWRRRTPIGSPVPNTVIEAMRELENIAHPAKIKACREGKYFKIKSESHFTMDLSIVVNMPEESEVQDPGYRVEIPF